MWPFTRKRYSLIESGLLKGATDWHCHILPGVDDGIRTVGEALDALSWYGLQGVAEVWLTPHVMEDIPNATEPLRERFSQLEEAYCGPVKLHLASENMLDSLFAERLASRDLLPLGTDGKNLLVETSYFNPPAGFNDMLGMVAEAGYEPVLAHPERYVYMDMTDYRALAGAGIKMQLNLPSLCGSYGRPVQKKAQEILKAGLYSMCGSDLHRLDSFRNAASAKVLDGETVKLLEKLK